MNMLDSMTKRRFVGGALILSVLLVAVLTAATLGGKNSLALTNSDNPVLSTTCYFLTHDGDCKILSDRVLTSGETVTINLNGNEVPLEINFDASRNNDGMVVYYAALYIPGHYIPEQITSVDIPSTDINFESAGSDSQPIDGLSLQVQTPSSNTPSSNTPSSETQGSPQTQQVQTQQAQTRQANNQGYPCPGETHVRCGITQPSGPGVVTIDVNDDDQGTRVSIERDGETKDHKAVGHHTTPGIAETTESWQEAVDEAADNADITVIFAANGNQSEDEQVNRQRIERELYDRGEPYTVCFEDITYTKSDGTVVTVPGGDCVTITPK